MKIITFIKKNSYDILAELSHYFITLDDKKTYTIEIKEKNKRRSLDANAYMWVLLDKLAEKMILPKEEIYKNLIKEVGGTSEYYCARPEAIKKLSETWVKNGMGYQFEIFESKLDKMQNIILYYGSSSFDTKQMSHFLELIIYECEKQDIETKTPQEIERLCREWGD